MGSNYHARSRGDPRPHHRSERTRMSSPTQDVPPPLGITRAFFPHGLGHSLGLQVHDVGCKTVPPAARNPFLRNTSTVGEHQCLTIEPGIYFVDTLLDALREGPHSGLLHWKVVDALLPFGGVRVEDDLVITADSSRNLTRDNWPS